MRKKHNNVHFEKGLIFRCFNFSFSFHRGVKRGRSYSYDMMIIFLGKVRPDKPNVKAKRLLNTVEAPYRIGSYHDKIMLEKVSNLKYR